MVNDSIADVLARIQNGIIAKKAEVVVPSTRIGLEILRILKENEMIVDFTKENGATTVLLKYREDGPEVTKLVRKSSPGQRIYVSSGEIVPIMNGRGISIVSTSMGLMTGAQAKSKGIGGELICEIW